MHDHGKTNSKSNQKGKGKMEPNPRKGGNPNPPNQSSNSKERKGNKGKFKCNNFHHGYHPEYSCMKRTIDLMVQTLQQNNLGDYIPMNAKKKQREKEPQTRGNDHALIAINSLLYAWIIDS